MRNNRLQGWSKQRLRIVLFGFFLALLVPTAILIKQAYSQLKWEAFHRHRAMAEELVQRIDRRYSEIIQTESARRFTEYAFLNIAGEPDANFLQRSPLSNFPVDSAVPGIIGYFQIDPQGRFTTPLLPDPVQNAARYGISQQELAQRRRLQENLQAILSQNQLVQKPPAHEQPRLQKEAPAIVSAEIASEPVSPMETKTAEKQKALTAQLGFDKLQQAEASAGLRKKAVPKSLGRVEDLKLEDKYQQKPEVVQRNEPTARQTEQEQVKRVLRKERGVLPDHDRYPAPQPGKSTATKDQRVRIFESEVDAFELSALDSGQFVLYRKVWRDGQRFIQGLLFEPDSFIREIINPAFYETALSRSSRLAVAWQGNVLSVLDSNAGRNYLTSSEEMRGTLLYQAGLSAPMDQLGLIFSIEQLPAGPGGTVVTWLTIIILLILCGGFLLLYRLASRQMVLARQQQDFISAVSHELKTPLTSIRMYGEILREGWATEDKRKTYYDFIFEESERLTRLINNVLQLARMTRRELKLDMKIHSVAELMDMARSKVTSQIERAGFHLALDCPDGLQDVRLEVDADNFVQILINLVDNALKFSAKSQTRQIDIGCQRSGNDRIQFSVRDYGPGIAREQMRKIFRLFYRTENELTRETVGTGIGLALVQQLVQAMHGEVDVVNRELGAEFRISFPVTS